jgi:hypothetical protein
MHFREIGPLLFSDVNGPDKIAFVTDSSGRHTFYINFPAMAFQQVNPFWNHQVFNYVVIGFSLCVIALTLVFWPIAAILRKHYAKPLDLSPEARRLRVLVHVTCLLVVAFVAGLVFLSDAVETPGGLGSTGDLKIHLLQFLGVLTAFGAVVAVINALVSWRDTHQWLWYRIWNALLATACVGFFWFIYHWHLLNFRLNY